MESREKVDKAQAVLKKAQRQARLAVKTENGEGRPSKRQWVDGQSPVVILALVLVNLRLISGMHRTILLTKQRHRIILLTQQTPRGKRRRIPRRKTRRPQKGQRETTLTKCP